MQEKFYVLKPAVDTEETGSAYPAVESFNDYDFNAPKSVYKLNSNELPNFEPEIRFKLAKGAKLCNLLGQGTISAKGLLVDDNFKTVIEQSNTIPFKSFNAYIKDSQEQIKKYNWIHFLWREGIEYFNFNKSKFKVKRASKDLGDIQIDSYLDLQTKQGELGFIKMIHNYESVMKNPNFDLFLHPLNGTIYITETLKRKIEQLHLTGIDITPAYHLQVI